MLPLLKYLGPHHFLLKYFIDFIFPLECRVCKIKIRTLVEAENISNTKYLNSELNPIIKCQKITKYLSKRLFCNNCFEDLRNSEILSTNEGCNICGSLSQVCSCKYIFSKDLKIRLRSLYVYTSTTRKLIHSFKFNYSKDLNNYLCLNIISKLPLLFQSNNKPNYISWDLIIHIPSETNNVINRGSYSSLYCAKLLSEYLSITNVITPEQKKKNNLRRTNLSLNKRLKEKLPKYILTKEQSKLVKSAKRILIIDDVITTGGSILGLIQHLRSLTQSEIDIITLGRSKSFKANFFKLLENNNGLGMLPKIDNSSQKYWQKEVKYQNRKSQIT